MVNVNTNNAPILSKPPKNDPMEVEKLLKGIGDKIGQSTERALDTVIPAALGPLNLVMSPIQDLFGIDAGKGIKDGLKKVFSAPTGKGQDKVGAYGSGIEFKKRSLNEREIMKVDPGAAFIARQLGADSSMEGGGFLSNLLGLGKFGGGGFLAKLFPMIGKLGLVGGIIWMAVDGIRGFLKADEWGVSKVSGMMGGLLGGMDEELSGGFKNMGKWALTGAGIGSLVPVLGTLVGGLIGAAVGFLLGFIGGEKIAKAFDAVGTWFMRIWDVVWENFLEPVWNIFTQFLDIIISPFRNLFGNIKEIWQDDEKSIGKRIGSILGSIVMLPIDWIVNLFKGLFVGEKGPDGKKIKKGLVFQAIDLVVDLVIALKDGIIKAVRGIGSFIWNRILKPIPEAVGRIFEVMGDIFSGFVSTIRENPVVAKIGATIGSIFDTIKNIFDTIFNTIKNLFDTMVSAMKDFVGGTGEFIKGLWETVRDGFGSFVESISEWLSNLNPVQLLSDFGKKSAGAIGNFFGGGKNESVNDAIITSSGKVIHTHPDDNIVATKNDLRLQQDLDSMSRQDTLAYINDKETHSLLEELIGVIRETGAGATNIINTPSRFSPGNMYAQLSAVR